MAKCTKANNIENITNSLIHFGSHHLNTHIVVMNIIAADIEEWWDHSQDQKPKGQEFCRK